MNHSTKVDLARYRFEKATMNLMAARDVFALGYYADTVAKSYYAIFTAMRALLAMKELDSIKHSGVIALFHKTFMKEDLFPKSFSKMISDAKKIREKADYGDFFRVSKDVAQEHLKNAELFLSKAEIVLRNLLLKNNGK